MILMYHKVHPDSPTQWWVSVDDFYRQMWELQSRQVVYLDDYDPFNREQVVITFDGVYDNVLRYAAPIMHRHGYPFELFVTGDMMGHDNAFDSGEPPARFASRAELDALQRMGGRIQWHTRSHPDLSALSNEAAIAHELEVTADLSGTEASCRWFAYPYGRRNAKVRRAVSQRFAGAVACDDGLADDRYALPRVTVTNESRFRRGTISCIIASYNYGSFLVDAVESVLRQTIPPDDILITDDCSVDETPGIAHDLMAQYPDRIRFNRNSSNLGIVAHFNLAVGLTRSDYVMILGADNRLRSNYIEKCAALLERDPEVGVAYTDFDLFGPRAGAIYQDFPEQARGGVTAGVHRIVFPDGAAVSLQELHRWNVIHGSSMFRRSAFDAVGGYVQRAERPEDHDLFLRMVAAGYRAEKAHGTALEYRQHSMDQANILFTSNATLLHYVEKSRRLERELSIVRGTPWPWLQANVRVTMDNAKKFVGIVRTDGMAAAVREVRHYVAGRRAPRSARRP